MKVLITEMPKKIATFKEFHGNLVEKFDDNPKSSANTFDLGDYLPASQFHIHKNNLEGKLPESQEKAIRGYSRESHKTNNWLHKINDDPSSLGPKSQPIFKKHHKEKIFKIDEAFANKKNHVGIDHEVFTGLPESPEKVFKKDRENNPNHDPAHVHVHLPAFTSTSTDLNIAKNFSDPSSNNLSNHYVYHVLHIRVPKDHPSMSIKSLSKHKREDEVLLHRGTRLKIHATPFEERHETRGFTKTYKIWHADVVGHKPDDLETK